MKRTLIRYKTKPGMADANAELIAGVFAELKAAKLEGVRYLSLRLDDDTFVHFVETESESESESQTHALRHIRRIEPVPTGGPAWPQQRKASGRLGHTVER